MAKYAGHDVTFAWDPAGGTAYATIAQIVDLSGPGLARNAIDTTTRDNATAFWRTFVKGFKDAGEMTFNVLFDPSLASHSSAAGLLSDYNDDSTEASFRVTFPDAAVWTFGGFLTDFSITAPLDDNLGGDITVKISGQPTLA